MKKTLTTALLSLIFGIFSLALAQAPMKRINLTLPTLTVSSFIDHSNAEIQLTRQLPLFTLEANYVVHSVLEATASSEGDSIVFTTGFGIKGVIKPEKEFSRGWKCEIRFINSSQDKIVLGNVVPLGKGDDRVYIDAARDPQSGPNRLSRSRIFRPGLGAVGVVLPDNAWEMGFCDVEIAPNRSLVAIARRTDVENSEFRRFTSILKPGGSVSYVFYVDEHIGDWQQGLKLMCKDRYIYDLENFDNTLYEREDLKWIRYSYLLFLQFSWDKTFYDAQQGKYNFYETLLKDNKLHGGYDAYMIWPTWPRLGLDQRNQFDLYRDLPGGNAEILKQSQFSHKNGVKYFISYNPWDEATRYEDHLKGMEKLLRSSDGDGVVLDTRGESSKEFQEAADRVKPGIIMYSEGMAVPKDMPSIVAGRVHDAIYMPPPFNLNKYIKPDIAIFRVLQVVEGKLHREAAVAFFNGYGTEINIMRPGRPDWIESEFRYLGKTIKILRDNSSAFLSNDWMPLIRTTKDSIWVNRWPIVGKTIYTVFSLVPEGFTGPLFEVPETIKGHYISLWHHEDVQTTKIDSKTYVPAIVEGFSRSYLGTRDEGNVDCIANFPNLLTVSVDHDSLSFDASSGKKIIVWGGDPTYDTRKVEFPVGKRTISLREHLGKHEEKFVVQLFDERELLDERIVFVKLATPRLISQVVRTTPADKTPRGMIEIPATVFNYQLAETKEENSPIPYPDYSKPRKVALQKFYIDQYPVNNAEFKTFLQQSKYKPKDTTGFLRHWTKGIPPKGTEKHPVIWVSMEDMKAYCAWTGKRLPTDAEWQYAAQGTDARKYPWGNEMDSTKCNFGLNRTTPVDAFPAGASPFGVRDLVGNVWQLTNDVYDNGTNYYGIIRGGSYYNPTSSIWYVRGGPWTVDQQKELLFVSPSFDRSSTVGFRCVKDAK
jgi:formylglycine-generating enzyme required for sulfatase activity